MCIVLKLYYKNRRLPNNKDIFTFLKNNWLKKYITK